MSEKHRIGVLNKEGQLIGAKFVAKVLAEHPPDPGDLPLSGTYKFMRERGAYIPLGHGFDRVQVRQPYATEFVLARMIETQGDKAPLEAKEWLKWYNETLRIRHEELHARLKRG